jgi:hypothetical protein
VHGSASKRHLGVPYLTADSLTNSTATKNDGGGGTTAATDGGAARVSDGGDGF